MELEREKEQILKEAEIEWRLKSRALWLEAGDQNTKYFQKMATHCKNYNTIWEVKDAKGHSLKDFAYLSESGVIEHFKSIYTDLGHQDMLGMLQVIETFPLLLSQDQNQVLYREVSLEELNSALKAFQRDKILRLDGWPPEFFMDFFDTVGEDLLKMVEEVWCHTNLS